MNEERISLLKKGTSIFERLQNSPLLNEFHTAFRSATGLPLRLVGPNTKEWTLQGRDDNRSPFCVELNTCGSACDACRDVNQKLLADAEEVPGASTCHCFTGMTSTAVPIKLGPQIIAYLRTGQVFTRTPTESDFEKTLAALHDREITPEVRQKLHKAYFNTRQLTPERFQSMVDLLVIFGSQLSVLAEELALACAEAESVSIKKARQLIHENLDQKLSVAEIARLSGVSTSHFSRTFKDEVGITVTEYITRSRINWACRELGRPNCRISDVAFLVGFQSLSQFNRAFLKIVGKNPTDYRREKLASLVA